MISRIMEKIIDKKIDVFKKELDERKARIQQEWDETYSWRMFMGTDRETKITERVQENVYARLKMSLSADQEFINRVVNAINRVQLRGEK